MSENGSEPVVVELDEEETARAQRQANMNAAREAALAARRTAPPVIQQEVQAQVEDNAGPVSDIDSLRATVLTIAHQQNAAMAEMRQTMEQLATQQAITPTPRASPAQRQRATDDEAAYLERAATTVLELPQSQRDSIKMRMPAVFNGEADKVQRFVDAWDTILASQASRPAMQQIALVAQYMEEGAFVWYKTERLNDHENEVSIFTSWATFSAAMLRQFAERQPDSTIMDHLLRVRQTTSAAEYNTRFNALMLKLQKPMQATVAIHLYVRGLKDDVQIKLAGQEYATLSAQQRAAADIDATLFRTQRRINARTAYQRDSLKMNEVEVAANEEPNAHAVVRTPLVGANPGLAQEVAAILSQMNTRKRADQSKWTQEMKDRYAKNLCFTCAASGHSSRFCPQKRLKE